MSSVSEQLHEKNMKLFTHQSSIYANLSAFLIPSLALLYSIRRFESTLKISIVFLIADLLSTLQFKDFKFQLTNFYQQFLLACLFSTAHVVVLLNLIDRNFIKNGFLPCVISCLLVGHQNCFFMLFYGLKVKASFYKMLKRQDSLAKFCKIQAAKGFLLAGFMCFGAAQNKIFWYVAVGKVVVGGLGVFAAVLFQ